MDNYFSRFPVISYSNTAVLDVSRRVYIAEASHKVPNMFYPVELLSGMRADVLADAYYKDSEQDWIIYLSNQIVDPYYQWYMNEEELQSYILDKYGDRDYPKQKIKFYRNNWATDDTELTVAFYNTNLAFDQKQYYSPLYGEGARIVGFRRKRVDWTTNTNKIFQYTIGPPPPPPSPEWSSSANSFIDGELVKIRSGDIHAPNDGAAEVITSNATTVIVKNVSGNSLANSQWLKVIVGELSSTTVATRQLDVLQENITNTTANFWAPVSYYDWEVERNEERKHVHVLNPSVVLDTSNAIRKSINT